MINFVTYLVTIIAGSAWYFEWPLAIIEGSHYVEVSKKMQLRIYKYNDHYRQATFMYKWPLEQVWLGVCTQNYIENAWPDDDKCEWDVYQNKKL